MKDEIKSLELKYLSEELKQINGSRVDNIYQLGKEFYFAFYKRGGEKLLLRILLPNFIYLSSEKPEFPESPTQFCSILRKFLKNTFLQSVEQLESERILRLEFESKENRNIVYIELFSRGNLVLCDSENRIMHAVDYHRWSERNINRNEIYRIPQRVNIFRISSEELNSLLKENNAEIVRFLARNLGLGSTYAEELCLISGIDKNKKSIDDNESTAIYDSLRELVNMKSEPHLVYEQDRIVDCVPFRLRYYENLKQERIDSFSTGLEKVFSGFVPKKRDESEIRMDKLKRIIENQEKHMQELEQSIAENTRKAESIYENYTLIKGIIDDLNNLKKTHTWEEIKKRLRSNQKIKDIREKERKVVLDV